VQIIWENPPPGSRDLVVQEIYRPAAPTSSGNPGRPTISLHTSALIPAGARLRLHLDRTRITSVDGDALEGPEELVVETAPFSVRLAASTVTVAKGPPTLVFNNKGAFDLPKHVTVTEQGAPVDVYVAAGNLVQNEFMVLGPDGGLWHAGHYDAVVDAGAADDFGQPLGAPMMLSFEVQ
jgi:hypothetical protein